MSERRRVVVGYDDDSPNASAALHWGVTEAATRDALLRVVNCSAIRSEIDGSGANSRSPLTFERAVYATRERWPSVPIEMVATSVETSDTLLAEAIGANLLVVTTLDAGAVRRERLGPFPSRAARRSSCPVVVVQGTARRPIRRIVVGINTFNASATAIDWSIVEAELHGAELVIAYVWEPDPRHTRSIRADALDRADAQCFVDLAVRRCEKQTSVPVRGEVIRGSPALALVTRGRSADLLVVGSRGRTGFTTLTYGSVALFVAAHASCAVAVVHPRLRDSSLTA
ncbi:MAG: universal stress protein [Ilumatobacteraceae bacterium]